MEWCKYEVNSASNGRTREPFQFPFPAVNRIEEGPVPYKITYFQHSLLLEVPKGMIWICCIFNEFYIFGLNISPDEYHQAPMKHTTKLEFHVPWNVFQQSRECIFPSSLGTHIIIVIVLWWRQRCHCSETIRLLFFTYEIHHTLECALCIQSFICVSLTKRARNMMKIFKMGSARESARKCTSILNLSFIHPFVSKISSFEFLLRIGPCSHLRHCWVESCTLLRI